MTQELSFVGYTNSIATIKCWDSHNKKIKYCSSETFDEHKHKFGKGLSPGSELMTGTNVSTLPKLNIDISDHPFIKYDIFEFNVTI